MSTFAQQVQTNLTQVQQRIAQAAHQAGRSPADITLIAVSKTFPASAVIAAASTGQRDFAENYVQEAVDKMQEVNRIDPALAAQLRWHFIGPIQSNKTRLIAEHFDWVHTIDRLKIAERLSAQRRSEQPPLHVLIQVNIDDESSKSGITPQQIAALSEAITHLPHLNLRGLMTIPNPTRADQHAPFAHMHRLLSECQSTHDSADTLSMGMSADLEAAIHEGATMIRIGSAIFGERH